MKSKQTPQKAAYIGIDLGDKKHAICVTDKDGVIIEEYFITNTRQQLESLSEKYPESQIAMEVGTHSPWISRLLKSKDHKVIVANARKLRAIYTNERKSDKEDARILARFLRADVNLLHPIEHVSEESQKAQLNLKLRNGLVKQRAALITTVRGVMKGLGHRLPACSTASFHKKALHFLQQHPEHSASITPVLDTLEVITEQIAHYEQQIADEIEENHPQAVIFQEIPSIGPITALAFTTIIGSPDRFKSPRDVGAWLGLVPRRDQSGESDKQLPITKTGNGYLRTLLVQCAQYLLGHFGPECALREAGLKIANRGGRSAKKKAVIATARKLAVMMMAMWQKQTTYQPYPETQTT